MHTHKIKRPRRGLELRNRGLSKQNHRGIYSMRQKVARYRGAINVNDLPLFAWGNLRNHHRRAPSYAVRHLQRTRTCSASVAALYAELAGLPVEDA